MDTQNWYVAKSIEEKYQDEANKFIKTELINILKHRFPRLKNCQYCRMFSPKYNNGGVDTNMQLSGIDKVLILWDDKMKQVIPIKIEEKFSEEYSKNKLSIEIINYDRVNKCQKPGWTPICSSDIIIYYKRDKIYIISNIDNLRSYTMDWYNYWKENCNKMIQCEIPCNHSKGNWGTQIIYPKVSDRDGSTWKTGYTQITLCMMENYFHTKVDVHEKGLEYYKKLS